MSNVTVKFLGITDEYLGCDCCGRDLNRKHTIVLDIDGAGEVRYGSSCAAKALAGKKVSMKVDVIIERAQVAQRIVDMIADCAPATDILKSVTRRGYQAELRTYVMVEKGINPFTKKPLCVKQELDGQYLFVTGIGEFKIS